MNLINQSNCTRASFYSESLKISNQSLNALLTIFGSTVTMAAPSITTLQEIFEVEKLSAEQEKAIDSLLAKKDVFLSLRTGGGKSLCYMAFPIFYE